jgi:hypothetical protein
MPILLTLVVEEDGRTTEVAFSEGPFVQMGMTIAKNIDHKSAGKKSFSDKGYIYNVLVANNVVYLCVSKEKEMKQRILFHFLNSLKEEYEERHYSEMEETHFAEFIEDQMDIYSHRPEEVDKMAGIQKKVDDVTYIAHQNLQKLLEREGRLEDTINATEKLQSQSTTFAKVSKSQKWKEWRRNLFWTIALIFCCLLLLGVVIGVIVAIIYSSKHS